MLGCVNNLITGITVIVNLEHLSRRLFFVIALTSNEKKKQFYEDLKNINVARNYGTCVYTKYI